MSLIQLNHNNNNNNNHSADRRMSSRSSQTTAVTVSSATHSRSSGGSGGGSCSRTAASSPNGLQSRGFADTANIRIPIVGYEVMEERARFTVYKLRIENPFTNDCWLVLRRYTDFVRLHKKLKSLAPSIQLNLPRKNLFGNNFGNAFLEQRVQGLQTYVNSIMACEVTRASAAVREFFCLEEPPTYSDSLEECRSLFEAQEETICHLKLQLQSKDEEIQRLQQKLAMCDINFRGMSTTNNNTTKERTHDNLANSLTASSSSPLPLNDDVHDDNK